MQGLRKDDLPGERGLVSMPPAKSRTIKKIEKKRTAGFPSGNGGEERKPGNKKAFCSEKGAGFLRSSTSRVTAEKVLGGPPVLIKTVRGRERAGRARVESETTTTNGRRRRREGRPHVGKREGAGPKEKGTRKGKRTLPGQDSQGRGEDAGGQTPKIKD